MNIIKATVMLITMPAMTYTSTIQSGKPTPSSTCEIIGTVTDHTSSASLSKAIVVLSDSQGALVASTSTGLQGTYSFPSLSPGTFNVKVSLAGYKPVFKKGIVLVSGKKSVINFQLEKIPVVSEVPIKKETQPISTYDKVNESMVTEQIQSTKELVNSSSCYTQGANNFSYRQQLEDFNTEQYDYLPENEFRSTTQDPLSTFSIDVDRASYSNIRRFISNGQTPPKDAVRIEEMINYFSYEYPQPRNQDPFSINTEVATCPWNEKHRIVQIGLQGKKIETENLPPSNLVFLIDVSGSMMQENKLPLVKQSLKLLVNQLRNEDRVALVVYAGSAGLVLEPTSGRNKEKIMDAIGRLEAGGSTAGGAGIKLAYETAKEYFMREGNNRVILATDGDFNVGASSDGELVRLIEEKRETGVFLTVLGFGMGNLKDSRMEKLADKGNGNYSYIDNLMEAKKVMVSEMGGTLMTIAKDVKIQVEFNPAKVSAYKLIGYENRLLNKEDFNDDKKDAGEMGAGHTVTALYEIVPVGEEILISKTDPLRYQQVHSLKDEIYPGNDSGNELLTVKFRYKEPQGTVSKLIVKHLNDGENSMDHVSDNLQFSSAVAEFGMLLRDSKFKGDSKYSEVLKLARAGKGTDAEGYRGEFIRLVELQQLQASR